MVQEKTCFIKILKNKIYQNFIRKKRSKKNVLTVKTYPPKIYKIDENYKLLLQGTEILLK